MTATRETIEVTAGEVTAELKQRGVSSDAKVTLTMGPELFPGRRESRRLVIVAGLERIALDWNRGTIQERVNPLGQTKETVFSQLEHGLTGEDIDRLIEPAREEVAPRLG